MNKVIAFFRYFGQSASYQRKQDREHKYRLKRDNEYEATKMEPMRTEANIPELTRETLVCELTVKLGDIRELAEYLSDKTHDRYGRPISNLSRRRTKITLYDGTIAGFQYRSMYQGNGSGYAYSLTENEEDVYGDPRPQHLCSLYIRDNMIYQTVRYMHGENFPRRARRLLDEYLENQQSQVGPPVSS